MLVKEKGQLVNFCLAAAGRMLFAGRWSVKDGTEGSGCAAEGKVPRVVNGIKQEEVGRGGAVQGTRLGWRTKGRGKP